jgi:hypothetical protein
MYGITLFVVSYFTNINTWILNFQKGMSQYHEVDWKKTGKGLAHQFQPRKIAQTTLVHWKCSPDKQLERNI